MQAEMISKPIPVGNKTAPNRIVFQPMECNDADASGDPSELQSNAIGDLRKAVLGLFLPSRSP